MKIRKLCGICPYINRQDVKYEGSFDSEIVIIGESPGNTEIRENRPFVGRSGILLNSFLKYININRKDIYISNSTRCMIKKNEDGAKDQGLALKYCRAYLELAIQKVQPKLIILLGAYALRQILKKQKIMQNRGRFFWSDEFNCYVFVTIHPSYILRGCQRGYPDIPFELMNMREKLPFSDFKLVRDFIDNNYKPLELKTEEYKKVNDLSNINMQYVAVDSELNSLNLQDKNNKMLSIGFSWKEKKAEVIIL